MLTDVAVKYLSALKRQPDAVRMNSYLPLGGIYWVDEIPDLSELLKMAESDRGCIFKLFSIRFRIWNSATLTPTDQEFWDAARSIVPEYPLFQRLVLSVEDRSAQHLVEQEVIAGFDMLFEKADKVELTQSADGLKGFSMHFDLTQKPVPVPTRSSWWKRWWPWR